jgi:hypothetical protein
MANAAGHLRGNETFCSSGVFGLDGSASGKALGDLATIICSYDHTAGYSSNSLSSYFHDFGWRSRIHDLVAGNNAWLGLNADKPGLSLGGNYGEASPADLGYTLTTASDPATPALLTKTLGLLFTAMILPIWRQQR